MMLPIDDIPVVSRWNGTSVVLAVGGTKGRRCGWYDASCQSPKFCIRSCARLGRHEMAKACARPPITYTVTYRVPLDETAGFG